MRKAQVSQSIYFPYIIVMTVIIIVGFAIIPTQSLDDTIRVSSLDNMIMQHRFENKVSYTDPLTLRTYPVTLANKAAFKPKLNDYFIFEGKDAAYKMSFNGIEDTYNKELYLIASRTAPLGEHYRTTLTKQVVCLEEKNCGTVKFEQILPKVYDVK